MSLTFLTLRTFLQGETLYIYRDLIWPTDPYAYLSNAVSTFDLESLRRLLYLGPFFVFTGAFGFSSLDAEKLFFFLCNFLMGISAYYVVFRFLSTRTAESFDNKLIFGTSIIAGFFYLYNPLSVQKVMLMTFGFGLSYALIPFVFYFFDKAINGGKFRDIFLAALVISLSIAGTMQFLVLLPLFLLLPWLIITLIHRISDHRHILPVIKNFLFVGAMFILISSYWIVVALGFPFTTSKWPEPDYVLTVSMLEEFSSNTSVFNAFKLMGIWWPYVELEPIVDSSVWYLVGLTIPLMVVSSILVVRKGILGFYSSSFLLIGVFIIFFFKGTQPPFSEFYPFLYTLPVIGWIFRIPDTNGIFLPFVFMMTLAFGTYTIWKYQRDGLLIRYFKFVPACILVLSISIISWPIFTGDFGGIYNDNKPAQAESTISASSELENIQVSPSNMIAVGGENVINNLNSALQPSVEHSIMYADKDLGSLKLVEDSETVTVTDGANDDDLKTHFITKDSIVLEPFDATLKHDPSEVWSRASTGDPVHGPFHTYVNRFSVNNNTHFDYGKGLVLTWAKDAMDIPFSIGQQSVNYQIMIRYLQNPNGGIMKASLDNDKPLEVHTTGVSTRFIWKNLGIWSLTSGQHKIKLENVEGFNAVNMITLIPVDKLKQLSDQASNFVQKGRTIHVLGEDDLIEVGRKIDHNDTILFHNMSGTKLETFQGQVKIPNNASYASVEIWAKPNANASQPPFYRLTDFEMIPAQKNQSGLTLDFEEEDSTKIFSSDSQFATISNERDQAISGTNSLRVDIIKPTHNAWIRVGSEPITLQRNNPLEFNLTVSTKDTNWLLVRAVQYNHLNNPVATDFFLTEKGDMFEKRITNSILPHRATEYVILEFWTDAQQEKDSNFIVDDVSVIEYIPVKSVQSSDIFDSFQNLNRSSQNLIDASIKQLTVSFPNTNYSDHAWNVIKSNGVPIAGNTIYNYTVTVESVDLAQVHAMIDYRAKDVITEDFDDDDIRPTSLNINEGSHVTATIPVLKDSIYTLGVRAETCKQCNSSLSVIMGQEMRQYPLRSSDENFKWFYLPVYLNGGTAHVDIGAEDGQAVVDMAVVFPSSHENDKLTDALSTKSSASITRISKLDQTNYRIAVNATKPFVITFDRDYDPQWSLSVNGKSYNAFELYPRGINGFYIQDTGNLVIDLEYRPQVWFTYGTVITLLTIGGSLAFLTLRKSSIVGRFLQPPKLSRLDRRAKIKDKWTNDIHINNRFQAVESNKTQSKIIGAFRTPFYLFTVALVLFALAEILSLQNNDSELATSLGIYGYCLLAVGLVWKFFLYLRDSDKLGQKKVIKDF